jgi:predicted LPLAT superfamily acyltransferase
MKLCIVIPVYNHGEPLVRTVARLMPFSLPIILVDDGSDAANKLAIAQVRSRYALELVTLPTNGGKGAAVKAGLRAAHAAGFTHAIQVDADGQHRLEDLPKLIAAARTQPQALISGEPRFDSSVPAGRLWGRRFTNLWVWIETLSRDIPDTMCGFRIYPLKPCIALLDSVRLGDRMDFDIEIAVRLYWRGTPFVAIPTAVVYPEGGTSHFDLLRDNWLITKLHTKLVFGMLVRAPAMIGRKLRSRHSHWSRLGERGGVLGMRILFGAYRFLGRGAFVVLLYPVMAYFYLAAGTARRASRDYLARIRACGAASEHLGTFRHFMEFGHAVLDKGAMWAGRFPVENIVFDRPEAFEEFRSRNGGVLFIGSHLGNLEVLRAFGENVQGLTVNALVFTRHSEKFMRVLAAVNPRAVENMIQVDSLGPESVIALQDKLRSGEHVAIVGDRTSVRHAERSVRAKFLGDEARFPEGPFVLASLLGCPVYLLFCLRLRGQYRIFVEPFADPLFLPRTGRREALEEAVWRYAERLEYHCRLAPLQWFNFYDFWASADQARVH